MIVEINITPNPNVDDEEIRTFMSHSTPLHIQHTLYYPESSNEVAPPYKVVLVGWDVNNQPCQAKALCVEDSGDGHAWLIYGGKNGLRMCCSNTNELFHSFAIDNANEWGENYLYYDKSLYEKAIQPFIVNIN